jgi:phage shock protein PspC (stress-responsive transcriptional regulator)
MRKVTTVSLSGNAYQLEETAHDKISAYLDGAARSLGDNPDRAEILADLEQAIADKCDTFLGKHKTVISAEEAAQIIREMGPVLGMGASTDDTGSTAFRQLGSGGAADGDFASTWQESGDAPPAAAPRRRRLMRLPSEGMMGGVCAGIAAYFSIDVVWVRLAFVLFTFFTGIWFFVWLTMLIVMPAARTPEQMASARGDALSAREVMEMARKKSADIGKAAAAAARDAQRNLRETFGPRS